MSLKFALQSIYDEDRMTTATTGTAAQSPYDIALGDIRLKKCKKKKCKQDTTKDPKRPIAMDMAKHIKLLMQRRGSPVEGQIGLQF